MPSLCAVPCLFSYFILKYFDITFNRLERERHDLLTIQERRGFNSRHRSRPNHVNISSSLSVPIKCPTLSSTISRTSEVKPTLLTDISRQRPLPHISTPSLHWLNCTPLPSDETTCLTNSTNSLTDQIPHHKHHRSAVSKTFTLTRSGSASISPVGRSRESSDSSDNSSILQPRRQRTTTLFLTNKATSPSTECNALVKPGSLTSVGAGSTPDNKGGKTDESEIFSLHQNRTRPLKNSFISTSSCNFFTSNTPSRPPPIPPTGTTGSAQLPPGGGIIVLSSS